jgi:hypothetical protein
MAISPEEHALQIMLKRMMLSSDPRDQHAGTGALALLLQKRHPELEGLIAVAKNAEKEIEILNARDNTRSAEKTARKEKEAEQKAEAELHNTTSSSSPKPDKS